MEIKFSLNATNRDFASSTSTIGCVSNNDNTGTSKHTIIGHKSKLFLRCYNLLWLNYTVQLLNNLQ